MLSDPPVGAEEPHRGVGVASVCCLLSHRLSFRSFGSQQANTVAVRLLERKRYEVGPGFIAGAYLRLVLLAGFRAWLRRGSPTAAR